MTQCRSVAATWEAQRERARLLRRIVAPGARAGRAPRLLEQPGLVGRARARPGRRRPAQTAGRADPLLSAPAVWRPGPRRRCRDRNLDPPPRPVLPAPRLHAPRR